MGKTEYTVEHVYWAAYEARRRKKTPVFLSGDRMQEVDIEETQPVVTVLLGGDAEVLDSYNGETGPVPWIEVSARRFFACRGDSSIAAYLEIGCGLIEEETPPKTKHICVDSAKELEPLLIAAAVRCRECYKDISCEECGGRKAWRALSVICKGHSDDVPADKGSDPDDDSKCFQCGSDWEKVDNAEPEPTGFNMLNKDTELLVKPTHLCSKRCGEWKREG